MVELEHARELLGSMGLETSASLLVTLAFAARAENVILLGPPGVGIGGRPLHEGSESRSCGLLHEPGTPLIENLKRVLEQNRLERCWRVYLRPAALVIDEVGYIQINRQEAELSFRPVSERYEYGSIILTSNKYFSDFLLSQEAYFLDAKNQRNLFCTTV